MSHEAIHNLDSRKRSDEIAETSEKLLGRHEFVSNKLDKLRIKPRELVRQNDPNDIYSMDRIKKDEVYVAKRKANFAENDSSRLTNGLTMAEVKQLSEIAEYDIIRGINSGGWIPQGRALVASDFDDIANGVDMVLEIGSKSSSLGHLGIGVDVSFSLDLNKKFQRIKDEIDAYDAEEHRLGVVKYYQSKTAGIRGELSGLSRVVAAYDLGTLEDMAVKSDRLKDHIGQAILISEMKRQIEVFYEYAQDVNPACANQLQRSLQMITAIDSIVKASDRLEQAEYSKNRKADEAVQAGLNLFI